MAELEDCTCMAIQDLFLELRSIAVYLFAKIRFIVRCPFLHVKKSNTMTNTYTFISGFVILISLQSFVFPPMENPPILTLNESESQTSACGESIVLSVEGGGEGTVYNWYWDEAGILPATPPMGQVWVNDELEGEGIVYVVATDASGCQSEASGVAMVRYNELEVEGIELEYLPPGCQDYKVSFTIQGGSGNYTVNGIPSQAAYKDEEWRPESEPYMFEIDDENEGFSCPVLLVSGDPPSVYCVLEAINDYATVLVGDSIEIKILNNDTGAALSISSIVLAPNCGEAVVTDLEWGIITYKPFLDTECTEDSFVYEVTDAYGQTTTATVFVSIEHPCSDFLKLEYEVGCTDPHTEEAGIEISSVIGGTPPYQLSFNENPYIDFVPNQALNILTVGENRIIVRDSNSCLSDTLKIQVDPAPVFTVSLKAPIVNDIAVIEVEPLHQFNAPFRVMGDFTENVYQEAGEYRFEVDTTSTSLPGIIIRIRDTRECESDVYYYAFRDLILVGIDDLPSNLTDLQLYPNPNNGNFTLSLQLTQSETIEIKIVDLLGKEKLWQQLQTLPTVERHYFNLNHNLPSGLYFLQIEGKNWRKTEKLIIR